MKKNPHFSLSTTQIILLSFFILIITGSLLLALPISAADGVSVPYIDALFTATSSVCVTGLETVSNATTWSLFGQFVILVLMQIGGMGVITIMSGLMMSFNRKIGISDRMLIQDAFNLNTLSGLVKFIKNVLIGTFAVEGLGALLYMTVFVPDFGLRGIWISVFTSVSAFCNAGINIISENSLCDYVFNPMINFVTCILVFIGGIGYIVWWDVVNVLKNIRYQKWKCFRNMSLHSKIALSVSGILILLGAVAFFIFEYNNPLTMKDFSMLEKVQASIFQSVTNRSAGFETISQQNMTNASTVFSMLLMFIGGSPAGTAGGIKTVTIAVLILSAFNTIKNNDEVSLFNRTISRQAISKAVAVVSIFFIIMFLSMILLAVVTDAEALDVIYETVSATTTVGFTRNLTPGLNLPGKIIVLVTMYMGRIGPVSLVVAINSTKKRKNIIKNPTEEISVG